MLFNKLGLKAIVLVLVGAATVMAQAPKIVFVKSLTSTEIVTEDPDTEIRLMGSPYEFYILALNEDDSPCLDCNFNLTLGDQTSKGITILSGNEVVNGRATITIRSNVEYTRDMEYIRDFKGCAMLHVVGPDSSLTSVIYTKLQFVLPPASVPQFADIFDVHGTQPSSKMNIPEPYFSMKQEYLDGIGDSIVIYYYRNFYIDTIPNFEKGIFPSPIPEKIAVFWDKNEKDSVVFTSEEIKRGATCGAAAGLDEKTCLNRITLGGKKLSKTIKTSGSGIVKSWVTFCPKYGDDGTCSTWYVTQFYSTTIYDRIAPIILSAAAKTDSITNIALLKLTFSEPVMKTDAGVAVGDKVFSFFINNAKSARYMDYIQLANGVTLANKISETYTLLFNMSSIFPQPGDYIHFRSINGAGLIEDQSDYKLVDSIRTSNDAYYNWNTATGFDAIDRLPSPWVLIEKMTSSSSTSGKSSSSAAASSNSKASSERPDFYVKMTGPFEFEIVMDESVPSLAKQYVVMDMKGQVLTVGELNDKNALVKVPTRGAYVVKLGLNYQRVNIR